MAPSPGPAQAPGATVTFTAGSTGCAAAQYEFWYLPPGGKWTVTQPYGASTWSWTTSGLVPGTYQVGVWARQTGSTASYDAYYIGTYQLTLPGCSAAGISASPASPQAAGTRITFTASSSACAAPLYEFWEQKPGGIWTAVQGLGGGTSFSWDSTGSAAGTYNFAVWAVNAGSPNDYDSYATAAFSIS